MTDATNQPVSPPDADPATPANSSESFLGTTRGKLIAGGAVLALLVIAGVVGAAIFLFGGALLSGPKGGAATGPSVTPAPATTSAGAAAAPAVNPAEKPLSSSFTFRNVFAPTIMPPSAEATGIGDPDPQSVTAPTPAPTTPSTVATPAAKPVVTLTLTDIITEGDAHKGVFTYGTAKYTAGNGETIGNSPWKVLEVGTDSVLMLYGDTQMTITIGQGISK